MKKIPLRHTNLHSSRFIYGCMRVPGDRSSADQAKGKQAIRTAIEEGYNHFDHADIYGGGLSESLFSEVLKETPELREELIILGKCGVKFADQPHTGAPARYDLSQSHILQSVDNSLQRLGVEQLDILLVHRPDYLFCAEEVADTFQQLFDSGKVAYFGASNFSTSQISALQQYCSMPLVMNQVEINIHNISAFIDGTLDYCQQHKLAPSAWCPLGAVAYPAWGNTFTAEQQQTIATEFSRQAMYYDTQPWIIALAWLLRHPAEIMPIIGSTTPERIRTAKQALDIEYSRDDWYRLMEVRNGQPVP